ncbi:MAG: GNAT family N-acetyltransferase [Symbiobacteriia bacterium]
MLLVGEKVRLRRAMPADLEDRVRWNSDPRVMEFLPRGAVPSSREETLAYLRKAAEQTSEYIELAIETQEGKHVGGTTLRDFDWRARKAEFAIMIGEPDQWSKGYGTDAARLMLKLAFENLNLNRVWLMVDATNVRGITAYERAGFRQEGRLRQDRFLRGTYEDSIVMGILREEWQARAGDPRVS